MEDKYIDKFLQDKPSSLFFRFLDYDSSAQMTEIFDNLVMTYIWENIHKKKFSFSFREILNINNINKNPHENLLRSIFFLFFYDPNKNAGTRSITDLIRDRFEYWDFIHKNIQLLQNSKIFKMIKIIQSVASEDTFQFLTDEAETKLKFQEYRGIPAYLQYQGTIAKNYTPIELPHAMPDASLLNLKQEGFLAQKQAVRNLLQEFNALYEEKRNAKTDDTE